ncbi:MAG: cohesin domain-containing protein [bacterium]
MENRKFILLGISAFLLVSLIGCFGGGGTTEPTPPPTVKTISFTPSGSPIANSVYLEKVSTNNDEITLAVKIQGGTNVYAAALEINFDSSKIQYISALEGTYLNQGGTITSYSVKLEEGSTGVLLIGVSRQAGAAGVNGNGTIATVVLKALTVQTNTSIGFNITSSELKLPAGGGKISGVNWFGGSLSYQ